MPTIVPAIAAELINGAEDMLRQAAAVATLNQDNYIANGDPESIYGKLQQATARQACRRYADEPGNFSGFKATAVERACRPYLDDINYGTPPTISKPIDGGQCPVAYSVSYELRTRTSTNNVCGDFGDWSPKTGQIPSSPAPVGPIGNFRVVTGEFPLNFGQDRSVSYQFDAANGTYSLNLSGSPSRTYFSGCGVSDEVRGLVFTPVIPSDDDCAPVPPVINPPIPPIGAPGPPIEPYNPGPDIDIDIAVEVNIDGSIDIDLGTGPTTIDPFAEDPAGGGGGNEPPPGDIGEEGEGDEAGESGDAEGEAPEGSVLVGLRCILSRIPASARQYAPGVYRGTCYVYMGVPDRLDHDPAGAMMRSGQFVFAEKTNLTAWRVSANNGFRIFVTPYYREVEE